MCARGARREGWRPRRASHAELSRRLRRCDSEGGSQAREGYTMTSDEEEEFFDAEEFSVCRVVGDAEDTVWIVVYRMLTCG